MAVKSNEEIKKSRKIAVVWVIISLTASCLIGLIARGYLTAQLDDATSESVFIRTIQQLFSGNGVLIFIGGIFLCGILAAIMSTADSQLLVTASAVSEDLYKGAVKKNASEKSSLLVGKIAVAVVAVIAFFIALNPKSSIMGLVSDAWAGFGSAFGPVVAGAFLETLNTFGCNQRYGNRCSDSYHMGLYSACKRSDALCGNKSLFTCCRLRTCTYCECYCFSSFKKAVKRNHGRI